MSESIFTASNGIEFRLDRGDELRMFDGNYNQLDEYDFLAIQDLVALREFFAWQDAQPEAYAVVNEVFKPTSGRGFASSRNNEDIESAEKVWPRD